ncbi:MAG TPA: hypothetical protein VLA04_01620 [Verrucomicrobiae bacterium]|nr:hypothetical protein [Verrucomicrobiae bacterium]
MAKIHGVGDVEWNKPLNKTKEERACALLRQSERSRAFGILLGDKGDIAQSEKTYLFYEVMTDSPIVLTRTGEYRLRMSILLINQLASTFRREESASLIKGSVFSGEQEGIQERLTLPPILLNGLLTFVKAHPQVDMLHYKWASPHVVELAIFYKENIENPDGFIRFLAAHLSVRR